MKRISRRAALKRLAAASAVTPLAGLIRSQGGSIDLAGQMVEITIRSLSAKTVRITILPRLNGATQPVAETGALDDKDAGRMVRRESTFWPQVGGRAGDLVVAMTATEPGKQPPPADTAPASFPTTRFITIRHAQSDKIVQVLGFDTATPGMSFLLPKGPLLGLGEGGPQFDRKGSTDRMINGQSGYQLATNGTRAPVQWLIGTSDGWAMFIHQPYGQFDFTDPANGKFLPSLPGGGRAGGTPPAPPPFLPLDVFVVGSSDPQEIMREYARITGLAEMPARWTFGYLQSHRTLGGPEEIMGVARTFREKKLPCDAVIYLGTEFAPSGWNTRNGEFTWHSGNFPDPKKMLGDLHALNFKVIVHVVIEGRRLTGMVSDPCTAEPLPPGRTPDDRWPPDRQVSCYWPVHKEVMDVGVDGWWPDQGDGFDGPSRLNRHRMYWEGTQLIRLNERPFALHRNASAGVQRFGGFIWSGDVQTRWITLQTHIPVAINTGLSGLPYWGTDIGGFNPTADYTGELHVRWFQFGAFNPLFRAHGRNWHLRLPWGWDGGDGGPFADGNFRVPPDELKNKNVEPICRKYLELRYRLMPYLYTAVRECHDTGMPIMRALWLHDPTDVVGAARGDEYLWGRDILVAPVVEKGATTRRAYLPKGTWIDFWTNEKLTGGREIEKAVDLATMPLYVRAGAVIPMGPVKQYADEPSDEPLTLVVYPGADGSTSLYEDDGKSFDYRRGAWMRIAMTWRDATRQLSLRLAPGSRMLPSASRPITVQLAGTQTTRSITFTGQPVDVRL